MSSYCRICNGSLKRCIFCGYKGDQTKLTKAEKEQKEREKRWKRRMDHLGSIYNSMRKFSMQKPGHEIEGDTQHNFALNAIHSEVLEHIGDPTAPGAEEYKPFYKKRKNEV